MAKPKRYSPEQITRILKQQEAGLKVAEICPQAGICEQTFYRWKSRYGGMGVSEVHRRTASVLARAMFSTHLMFQTGEMLSFPSAQRGL